MLLSTLITLVCVVVSWSIQVRVKEYMVAFLVMETFMVGVFSALDVVLFYLFFEGILIPMFLIIGIWGGPRRVYSAFKFFLYTLAGSVLFLVAILVMYLQTGTTEIPALIAADYDPACRSGCGSPCSPRSRSRCRCGRSTPGCRMPTSRRRPPARWFWRHPS